MGSNGTEPEGVDAECVEAEGAETKADTKAIDPKRTLAKSDDDDATIRALVVRLSRPHSSGGEVIERAAIMAAGADSAAVIAWIVDHAGVPEARIAKAENRGLHGSRMSSGGEAQSQAPKRFVLPAGALV